jgi:hypothetical protein
MKEISYGKSACILLFSALGVFSYFLLLYHTEDKNIKNRKELYTAEGKQKFH